MSSLLTQSASATASVRARGVLVIDDDEPVRRLLAAGLKHHGFIVWLAANEREAVEIYKSHHTSIDLALLDVRMPGRDGPETLAALREFDPEVRSCFMTGEAGLYTQEDLLDLGALAVFRKPFRLNELAEHLIALTTPTDSAGEVPGGSWSDDEHPGAQVYE
jgi:CheY-like chemotaxis protein